MENYLLNKQHFFNLKDIIYSVFSVLFHLTLLLSIKLNRQYNIKCLAWGTLVAQWLSIYLPLAQVMIPGFWDRVPHQVPCRGLLLPLPVLDSLCVSFMNKQNLLKKLCTCFAVHKVLFLWLHIRCSVYH